MSRVAIVIGVDRTTGLAELTGAVSDAVKFSEWIASQGFSTRLMTDQGGNKVRFSDVFDEVDKVVAPGTCEQLVIYFSGHGFQAAGSEVWLLSGAPNNPGEAIALEASIMAARESGIKSIVFISDACRSIPGSLENNRVFGNSIFPNLPLSRQTRPKVDRFFATLPSLVAVAAASANDAGRRGGIFTRELIGAHHETPEAFVLKIKEGENTLEVVTHRSLGDLVREAVEDAVYAEAPKAGQLPDAIIESLNDYMGRVDRKRAAAQASNDGVLEQLKKITNDLSGFKYLEDFNFGTNDLFKPRRAPSRRTAEPDPPKPRRVGERKPSVAALARDAIAATKQPPGAPRAPDSSASLRLDEEVGLTKSIERYAAPAPVGHFESQTGFVVSGTALEEALWSSALRPPERLGPDLLRLWPSAPSGGATVLLKFADGSGALLPALFGYVGHIFFENGGIANVNYTPADNTPRWADYLLNRKHLEALRATVAAAANLGVFRVAANEAGGFADTIRNLKAIDPTLGLYAAYAYASAGMSNEIYSVYEIMRSDLGADLFDIAMLAKRDIDANAGSATVYPPCPVLRQGWPLLAVRNAKLPSVLQQAQQWLLPSLWATFAPEAMDALTAAMKNGEIK